MMDIPLFASNSCYAIPDREMLRISHLNIEAIAPSIGPENETILDTQYGAIPREIFYTGRSEDAGLLVSNGLLALASRYSAKSPDI